AQVTAEPIVETGAGFPTVRMRRLRYHPLVRNLVRETRLSIDDLILPLFVRPGHGVKKEIPSMPGNYQLSVDRLVDEVGQAVELGLKTFILFGIPAEKDATLPLLAQQCVSHARAGADLVAPSGMLDGMVRAIRQGLDAAGFTWLPIMSYAAKYASGFYGPFRDAAESPPQFGDRGGYQ